MDALKTITIHPPHEAAGIPGMKITETDVIVGLYCMIEQN